MNREAGLARLREVIADCLDVDVDEIEPSHRLIHDLGADSLDFIDLTFTVEDAFGVKLRGDDFDLVAILDLSKPDAVVEGKVNPEIVRQLQGKLPGMMAIEDVNAVTPNALFGFITVEALWRVVELRLNER